MRILLLFLLTFVDNLHATLPTVALIPYGDSKNRGHSLKGGYERTACHLFAQELKTKLESANICHVIITHSAQETLSPFHDANIVNQQKVSAALAITFYQSKMPGLQSDLFYRSTNNLITTSPYKKHVHSIIPADQAHLVFIDESKHLCETIATLLQDEKYKNTITCNRPLGIPLEVLHGIMVPSIAINFGLQEFGQRSLFLDPVVEGLRKYLSRSSF